MKIYDFHAHIYPEKIAQKAVEGVGNFYNIKMNENGTVNRLLELGDEAGIDRFIVHSVATGARQVQSVNDFISETVKEHPDRFVGFGTIHADFEGKCDEIERMISLGLSGVKIHPDSQHFNVDDPRMFEVYDSIQGRLPILVHCGDYRYDYDSPWRVRNVLDNFPKLTFIAAHFGGWSIWEEASHCLPDFPNIAVDTSSSFYSLKPEMALEIIRAYGSERVMFGTDYPLWNQAPEIEYLKRLDLTDEEFDNILRGTCRRMFRIQ